MSGDFTLHGSSANENRVTKSGGVSKQGIHLKTFNRREALAIAAVSMSVGWRPIAATAADDAAGGGRVFTVRSAARPPETADDTAAVELALAKCLEAKGGTLYFPAGTYHVGR